MGHGTIGLRLAIVAIRCELFVEKSSCCRTDPDRTLQEPNVDFRNEHDCWISAVVNTDEIMMIYYIYFEPYTYHTTIYYVYMDDMSIFVQVDAFLDDLHDSGSKADVRRVLP